MVLTLKLKLPNYADLDRTMETYKEALNFLSKEIFEIDPISPSLKSVNKVYYSPLKLKFGLYAVMTQSVMRDVIKMYLKEAKKAQRIKKPIIFKGSHIPFISNFNFKFETDKNSASKGIIYLKLGEKRTKFEVNICPYYQRILSTSTKICDSVLIKRKRKGGHSFFFCLFVEVPNKILPASFKGTIGIDVGVRRLATVITNKGKTLIIKGSLLTNKRRKFIHIRSRLQAKGTSSARRVLQRLRGKETRWAENHLYDAVKEILNFAIINKIGYIGIEDIGRLNLKKLRKNQRAIFSAWPYSKFMRFLKYKGEQEGFKIISLPPYNTSLACSVCGHIEKGNRKKQSLFECKKCGFTDNVDINAARNIESLLRLTRFNESDGVDVVQPDATNVEVEAFLRK